MRRIAVAPAIRRPQGLRRALDDFGPSGFALLGLLLLVPVGLTVTLRMVPALDLILQSGSFHVIAVSAIAAFSLIVAVFCGIAAARNRQGAVVLLAAGCLFVGIFMLGHGLTTPGVGGRPMNLWVGRFPILAIASFALCLYAASAAEGTRLRRMVDRPSWRVWALFVVAAAAVTALVAVRPTALAGGTPLPGEGAVSDVVIGASVLALGLTGWVHLRRWRLSHDPVQLGLVAACWLSVDAVISLELGHLWRISWWDYHAYLLAGFGAAAWALMREARRTHSIDRAVSTVSISDPLEHLARGYPDALHALVAAVEAKDRYTHGHSSRVAELAIRMGFRLGLPTRDLRSLGQGAFLHDIGKIGVPDIVLNKPDSLNAEEWAMIEAHPTVGWQIAGRAPSLRTSLSAIRHHHERWDGSGYPDHLTEREIPRAARIVSVADVWDAITSDRSYRPAWPLDKALAHMTQGRAVLFDPAVIEALVDLLGERGLFPERTRAELDALAAAATECHVGEQGPQRRSTRVRQPLR